MSGSGLPARLSVIDEVVGRIIENDVHDSLETFLEPRDSLTALSSKGMSCCLSPSPDPDHSFPWAGYTGYDDDDNNDDVHDSSIVLGTHSDTLFEGGGYSHYELR